MDRWDWLDVAIASGFWVIGVILARRRRLSARGQIAFTVIMFGAVLLQILLQKRSILPNLGKKGNILIAGVGLIILVLAFFRKQFFVPYVPMSLAVALILSVFVFAPGYVVSYSIYAIVCVLLLASWILTFKKTKPPRS
jgi:hypothetical protein